MDALCDYQFYIDSYHGKMDEESFAGASLQATAFLEFACKGKNPEQFLKLDMEPMKMACCAVSDAVLRIAERQGIKSESMGEYTVSYADADGEESLYKAAAYYLGNSGILFRGCASC